MLQVGLFSDTSFSPTGANVFDDKYGAFGYSGTTLHDDTVAAFTGVDAACLPLATPKLLHNK